MRLDMLNMYGHRLKNMLTLGLGVVMIAGAIWLVRSQVTVTGVDSMEGMIPHHSIAILTSERAQIEDVRVRELADEIIKAQRREIMEMQWLINDIKENGVAVSEADKLERADPGFDGSTAVETRPTPTSPGWVCGPWTAITRRTRHQARNSMPTSVRNAMV